MSHKVQQVKLSAAWLRDKIAEKFVLQDLKIIKTHEGMCCSEISRGHIPASFACVCVPNVILSLLHSPVTCPCYMSPMCEQHLILSLPHAPATCPCVMTPRVRGPLSQVINTVKSRDHAYTQYKIDLSPS